MNSNKVSNCTTNYNCSSNSVTPSKKAKKYNTPTTLLAPFLNDLTTLLNVRSENFEYQIVFIFTDGQIADIDDSMQVNKNKHVWII